MDGYTVEAEGKHFVLRLPHGGPSTFVSEDDAHIEGQRLAQRARQPVIIEPRVLLPAHEYAIPPGAPPTTCGSCGAAIVWTHTAAGVRVPLSLTTAHDHGGRRVAASHFTDCPHAREWSEL